MTDYIRKAVELADGWALERDSDDEPFYLYQAGKADWYFDEGPMWLDSLPQIFLDALAAQLVRQVDALPIQLFESGGVGQALVWKSNHLMDKIEVRGDDRTLNTIKAIVDSGVLESQ